MDCIGNPLLTDSKCFDFEELHAFNTSRDSAKAVLHQPRVQGPERSELHSATWGCSDQQYGRLLFPSHLQQHCTEGSHPQDMNSFPPRHLSVSSFTLLCSYKAVSQWQRKKKKSQTNTTQCFFLWETYWQADPVDSSQYSYLWTEDFLVKLGSFLGFYCFFPKLIAEFLNKVGASDLFLSSCKICFFPHNLFYRNQVSEKLKGKGQQHHLQSQPRLKEQSGIPNSFHQIWGS